VRSVQVVGVLFERVPSSRLERGTQEELQNPRTVLRADCGGENPITLLMTNGTKRKGDKLKT
jgi:hypothetical protein